ncbi:MAG: calcium-binding protein [Methylobacter sp.]|nr:MAG: calcium-binding protein [Methylobacter sp.]
MQSMNGTGKNDTLTGNQSDDDIDGGKGNDNLSGDAGNDQIHGGAGNDVIDGGTGDDHLYGDAGNDVVYGGDGNDTFYGDDGNDALYGDAGNDLFVFGDISGHTTVDGGSGNWTDVIEIDMDGGPSAHGGDWTLEIDGKMVDGNGSEHGFFDTHGESGTITDTNTGNTIDFDNIDKIEW